jgi:hypothetical protein
MPKRISKPKRPKDVNQNAFAIVRLATEPKPEPPTDAAILSRIMSEMGKKGGKIGGKRRMVTMTQEQRSQVALKAAKARWSKRRKVHTKAV